LPSGASVIPASPGARRFLCAGNAEWFVACLVLVFLINLMPSTWMVLAFFHLKFDLPLVPLCVSGATVSGFGRLVLANGSDLVTNTFFKKKREALKLLGAFLEEKKPVLPLATFAYALTPLPTNNLFVPRAWLA
jgi:hypothetical protein